MEEWESKNENGRHEGIYSHFSLSWTEVEVQTSLKPLLYKVRVGRHLTKTIESV